MISLRLLFSLNDHDWLDTVHSLSDELESGIIEISRTNGDLIESLSLSAYGASLLPTPKLPRLPGAVA
jgi:hypothetical protein